MEYIHYFETNSAFTEEYEGEDYKEPWVSYTVQNQKVDYNKVPAPSCYVDLGLPSGTLWACSNLGTDDPHEVGDFYAWGEIVPNKASYTWENYRFGPETALTKYNDTDGKTILDPKDDAVRLEYPEWHMPTSEQIDELLEYTTIETPIDSQHNYYDLDTDGTNYWITFKSKQNNNILTMAVDYELYQGLCGMGVGYEGAVLTWCNEVYEWGNYKASGVCLPCEHDVAIYYTDRFRRAPIRPVYGDGPAPNNGIEEADMA